MSENVNNTVPDYMEMITSAPVEDAKKSKSKGSLELPMFSEIEKAPAEWLISGYIPKKQITTICADGGVGKSSLWVHILSALTKGESTIFDKHLEVPEEWEQREPQTVMCFSGEDDVSVVLKQKFEDNKADESRIATLPISDPRFKDIKTNSKLLADLIEKYRPSVCLFDPIQAFIPPEIHMGERNAMRQCISPLIGLGADYGTTFIIVSHSNKRSGAYGRSRMADSADLWDISRSVLMLGATEEENIRYISHEKSNYGKPGRTILYGFDSIGCIEYRGTSSKKDYDFVKERNGSNEHSDKRDDVKGSIIEIMQEHGKLVSELKDDGADENITKFLDACQRMMPTRELDARLDDLGYSFATRKRAKSELRKEGIITYRSTGSGKTDNKTWYTVLSKKESADETEE